MFITSVTQTIYKIPLCNDLINLVLDYAKPMSNGDLHNLILTSPVGSMFKIIIQMNDNTTFYLLGWRSALSSNSIRTKFLDREDFDQIQLDQSDINTNGWTEWIVATKNSKTVKFESLHICTDQKKYAKWKNIQINEEAATRLRNTTDGNAEFYIDDSLIIDAFFKNTLKRIRDNDPGTKTFVLFDVIGYEQQATIFDVRPILNALKHNTNLVYLDFSSCYLDDESIEELVPLIANNQNPEIYALILSDNQITNEGAIMMANALKTNTHLEYFEIGCSQKIDHVGVKALVDALEVNYSLLNLGCDSRMDQKLYQRKCDLIRRNQHHQKRKYPGQLTTPLIDI